MKKLLPYLLVFSFGIVSTSCDKDSKNEDETPVATEVSDARTLSNALVIEGADRKSGSIPYNGNGEYGKTISVQTTDIVVTPNSEFDLVVQAEDNEGIIFVQLEGSNEYFEIPFKGNNVGGKMLTAMPMASVKLQANAMVTENFVADATVQTFTMPMQGQPVDFSNLSLWSPPQTVRFKAYDTGTGSITITLTWDKNDSDVDLWLIEPDDNKIFYMDEVSATGGYLDYDNTEGFGPENIFYDEESNPLNGSYQVKVHYYGDYGAGPVNYSVVVRNGSSVNTYRGSLSQEDEIDDVVTFRK